MVNSSIYEKQHISYAGFFCSIHAKADRRNHHFGAKVDRLNQILSTPNSDCESHLESLAVENREYDFVYFGSITDKVSSIGLQNVSFCSRAKSGCRSGILSNA